MNVFIQPTINYLVQVVTKVLEEPTASIFYLKVNTAGSSERPRTIYNSTRCHTAEDYNRLIQMNQSTRCSN